jgi:lysozyme family protein
LSHAGDGRSNPLPWWSPAAVAIRGTVALDTRSLESLSFVRRLPGAGRDARATGSGFPWKSGTTEFTNPTGSPMTMPRLTTALKSEYEDLFKTCKINAPHAKEVGDLTAQVVRHKDRYAVEKQVGVPWYVVGVIHLLEGSLNFDTHLHNGDPLTKRTVNETQGRPASGRPPFTWEASAVDALHYDGLDAWNDWSVGGTLYVLERYNGPGWGARRGVG